MDAATPLSVNEYGEISLTLGDQEMVLRPSFEAIGAFEAATGKGLMLLARAGIDSELSTGDVAAIAAECIRAWGRETNNTSAAHAKADKVGRMIQDAEGGFRLATQAVSGMLALAATGAYSSSGELKPATMTKVAEALVAG